MDQTKLLNFLITYYDNRDANKLLRTKIGKLNLVNRILYSLLDIIKNLFTQIYEKCLSNQHQKGFINEYQQYSINSVLFDMKLLKNSYPDYFQIYQLILFRLNLLAYQMISIPLFSQCISDSLSSHSENCDQSQVYIQSDQQQIKLANISQLLDDGLQLISGSQVKAGLRKLKQTLSNIQILDNFGQNRENINNHQYWRLHICCLFHISYSLAYLENEQQMVTNNIKLINLLQQYFRVIGDVGISNRNLKLKAFYSNFLLFSSTILYSRKMYIKAYTQAKTAYNTIKQILQKSLIQQKILLNSHKTTDNTVQFRHLILSRGLPKIKNILQNEKYTEIDKCMLLKTIKAALNTWKINHTKNLQQLKYQLKNMQQAHEFVHERQKRSILGVKKYPQKINENSKIIEIKDIIKIQQTNFIDYLTPQDILVEISQAKLQQKIRNIANSYFIMAESLRNINDNQFLHQQFHIKPTVLQNYKNPQKYQYIQLFYLKSIAVQILFVDNQQNTLEYFIQKYQKQFNNGQMIQIKEQDSKLEFSSSLRFSTQIKDWEQSRTQYQLEEQNNLDIPKTLYYNMNKTQKQTDISQKFPFYTKIQNNKSLLSQDNNKYKNNNNNGDCINQNVSKHNIRLLKLQRKHHIPNILKYKQKSLTKYPKSLGHSHHQNSYIKNGQKLQKTCMNISSTKKMKQNTSIMTRNIKKSKSDRSLEKYQVLYHKNGIKSRNNIHKK